MKPNGNLAEGPEYAALAAIDWADRKHFFQIGQADGKQVKSGKIDNTPEAIEEWVVGLEKQYEGRPIAVAIEQRRGAVVTMLAKYSILHIYPIHPLSLAKYRETWYPSHSKSDPGDTKLLWEMLAKHPERLDCLKPQEEPIRLLQGLTENRRELVDQKTAVSNRLRDGLKTCFPQILQWHKDPSSELVRETLLKWQDLEAMKQAKPAKLSAFYRQHGCNEQEIQTRLEQIQQAVVSTKDQAILGAAQPMIIVWVRQIQLLLQTVEAIEEKIETLAKAQKDWAIYDSLPGVGAALGPRLMVAMGTDRDRFQNAGEVQNFAGIAPVTKASGNSKLVSMRRACPQFTRQTFHEWAACSIPYSGWAKAYYDDAIQRGKKHHTIVRAIAFKWMRILFRCWKDGKPYDEAAYLARLAKHGSKYAVKIL